MFEVKQMSVLARDKGARRGGFTLVELLVVISVCCVLLSVLLPSLARSRMVVKTTMCASNLRQQAVAVHGYTVDQRDTAFPWTTRFTGAWMLRIAPYLGGNANDTTLDDRRDFPKPVDLAYPVLMCPENKSLPGVSGVYYGRTYGFNAYLSSGRNDLSTQAQRDAAWKNRRTMQTLTYSPSLIVLGGDSWCYSICFAWTDVDATVSYNRVHDGRLINMMFVDGHVSAIAKGMRNDLTMMDYAANYW